MCKILDWWKQLIKKYDLDQILVRLFFSATLIALVLGVMFSISPNSAYISYLAKDVESISNVRADNINGILETDAFMLSGFSRLRYPVPEEWTLTIGDVEYTSDDVYYIDIIPQQMFFSDSQLEKRHDLEASALYLMENGKIGKIMFSTYNVVDDTGEISADDNALVNMRQIEYEFAIDFQQFNAYFTTGEKNYRTLVDISNMTMDIKDTETGKAPDLPEPCIGICFINCSANMVLADGTTFQVCEVDGDNKIDSRSLGIPANYIPPVDRVTLRSPDKSLGYYATSRYSVSRVTMDNATAFSSKGSGELVFSYTRTPTQYTFIKQPFSVDDKNNMVNVEITYYTNDGTIGNEVAVNGKIVKKAFLSDNNLFPDLRMWFRENVYLAPLSLIATVYGVFAIKPKEKTGKDKEQVALERELLINLNRYLRHQNTEYAHIRSKENKKKEYSD